MLRCLVTFRTYLLPLLKHNNGVLTSRWRRVQDLTLPRTFSRTFARDNASSGLLNESAVRKGRSKPVRDLAFLVSEENVFSSSPRLQTPHDIKGFYRAVKAKGLLHELSSDEFSTFIRLFGSLSVYPESRSQSVTVEEDDSEIFTRHFLAPLLHEHQTSGRRTHWAFVLSMAKDKVKQGIPLCESDNYWLMRAALEDAKRLSSEDPKSAGIKSSLDRAGNYYMGIRSTKDEWFAHQLYLTAILDYGGTDFSDEIIKHLANLLDWKGGLPPSLRVIVWRVLASSGSTISPPSKTRFLHVLRKKIAKVQDLLPAHPRLSNEDRTKVRDTAELPRTYDALTIRDYFVDVMFSSKPGTRNALRHLHEIYPWALFECRAALCAFNDGTFATSEEEDRAAWNNLVLLSLSFATARKASGAGSVANIAPQQGLEGGVYSQSQVLGWTVICALAGLSSELHLRSYSRKLLDSSSALGVQEIARTLWFLWRKEEAWRAGAVTRSISLNCCVSTSFMALASASGDPRLAVSLVRHISDAIIYPARFGAETLDRSMLHDCAVHFAVLSATWGVSSPPGHSWDSILDALHYAQLIPDGQDPKATQRTNSIANGTLLYLAHIDTMLSHRLFNSASEYGLIMDDKVILSIGKALASEGRVDLALGYLVGTRISPASATQLLDVVLSIALRYHQDNLHHDLVRSFVEIFTNTSIRPTNNNALEAFVSACMRASYLEESMKIVQSVCESSSTLLRPQFLAQIVTALVAHRRYKLLGKSLKDSWHKTPGRRRSFFRSSRLRYTEELLKRFPNAPIQEVARSLPFSVHVWPVVRNHIPFHPRPAQLSRKMISLKLSSQLQKAGRLDERTLEHAVHLLVISGRITTAMKLLSKHAPTISTKAGNIILSACLRPNVSRRGRRQVRHASARLAQLLQERGFVPDRVTVNVLMKALLRWESITPKSTLRALFDRLTMSGYPLPDDFFSKSSQSKPSILEQSRSSTTPASRTVFGTDVSPSVKNHLPVNLKAFPKHISFTRHTRPLYKMFVKAFEVRGDFEGARRVLRVLREVKESVEREKAVRDEARRLGCIRARQKARSTNRSASAGEKQEPSQ